MVNRNRCCIECALRCRLHTVSGIVYLRTLLQTTDAYRAILINHGRCRHYIVRGHQSDRDVVCCIVSILHHLIDDTIYRTLCCQILQRCCSQKLRTGIRSVQQIAHGVEESNGTCLVSLQIEWVTVQVLSFKLKRIEITTTHLLEGQRSLCLQCEQVVCHRIRQLEVRTDRSAEHVTLILKLNRERNLAGLRHGDSIGTTIRESKLATAVRRV